MVADPLPFCKSLASSPRIGDRLLWLRIASDLILRTDRAGEALGAEFEAQFADCLQSADEGTRLVVAQKLCGGLRSPDRIVQSFLTRSDAAALWTFANAPRLATEVLRRAAGSRLLSRAIAGRDDLDEGAIDRLLASDELETRLALAGNVAAKLTRDQLVELVSQARDRLLTEEDSGLAVALLKRTPLSVDFAPLFLAASPAQRTQILLAAQRAELGRDRGARFAEISREAMDALERHALERRPERFEAALAEALGCPTALAARIARDPSGEPLAVALAAIRAPNDVCVRILTSRDMAEGPDYRRLGALARLQGALGVAAARAVISAIVGAARNVSDSAVPQPRHSAAIPSRSGADAVRLLRGQPERKRLRADKPA